ncbi:unnamed protein product [Rotaria magnacalcarata]|uniref:Uncharacterized protein n=1 Tax=Rotaria magnacalcarata TaxID=392030 RepID=A0A819J8Y7_9BILA|nr:unnamed protein product [Rotaria magnacalcarata]CAF3929307.1 unnamed protein product [Rotaria magnacalcarata]
MHVNEGSTLSAVRVNLKTIEEVRILIKLGKINVGSMIHPVKPYHLPIRINKCLKCLRHDHATKSCSRPRLCRRCAEEHSLEHGCPNHEKRINCGGDHISGHSVCPVVQEKRHALVEQSMRQRSELLIQTERQQHQYHCQGSDYSALLNDNQSYSSTVTPHQTAESSQRSYAQVAFDQRERSPPENIEYALSSFLNKMDRRLDEFSSHMSSQVCDIDKKINVYYDRQVEMENNLHETILPNIQELARVICQSSRNRNTQED